MNKIYIFTVLLSLIFTIGNSQINPSDSTGQVVGYWNIGDQQSYAMQYYKFQVQGIDTTIQIAMSYDVDIEVIDSTAHSYVIQWYYHNYEVQSENDLVNLLSSITEDMKIMVRTSEFGAIIEVVNWEEVMQLSAEALEIVKQEFSGVPQLEQYLQTTMNTFLTKEGIENNAIKDMHQFYTFHGGLYKLGEVLTGQQKVANNYGGNPFDAELRVVLDEMDVDNDFMILRSSHEIDSQQLTEATVNYLNTLAETMQEEKIDINDIGQLTNITEVASQIHGNSGWPLYSIETKVVNVEGVSNIEERIIQIK